MFKTNFSLNDDIFVEKYHKINAFQYKGMYWHPPKIKKLLKRKAFVTQYSLMGVWPFDNFWQIIAETQDVKKWQEKLSISKKRQNLIWLVPHMTEFGKSPIFKNLWWASLIGSWPKKNSSFGQSPNKCVVISSFRVFK